MSYVFSRRKFMRFSFLVSRVANWQQLWGIYKEYGLTNFINDKPKELTNITMTQIPVKPGKKSPMAEKVA